MQLLLIIDVIKPVRVRKNGKGMSLSRNHAKIRRSVYSWITFATDTSSGLLGEGAYR